MAVSALSVPESFALSLVNTHSTTIDRLYLGLGGFTNLYLLAIAVAFFASPRLDAPTFTGLLDALSEPYLGALAVYTVLKEIAKHRTDQARLRRGEWYVWAWLALLTLTSAAVAFSASYRFDAVYSLVITNSLASLMIYIGSRIRRP